MQFDYTKKMDNHPLGTWFNKSTCFTVLGDVIQVLQELKIKPKRFLLMRTKSGLKNNY